MKKYIFFLAAVTLTVMASAQTKTNEYLKKIPAIPKDSCNVTKANAEAFESQVGDLIEQLNADIDKLTELQEKTMEDNQATAEKTMMNKVSQQTGLSQADLEKLKNKKDMTPADKKALANQIMQQQTNMSMDDVDKLSKMSDAGKKAYAEAYATEAMATAQTDPNQKAKSENAMNMYELAQAQQSINNKTSLITRQEADLYAPINSDPERQKMLDRMDAWHNKIMSMTGIDYGQGKQMDSLGLLIEKEQIKYCNTYTPKYRAGIRQHYRMLKASIPDFQSFGKINAEMTKAQTGIDTPQECLEIGPLSTILQYLQALKGIYAYKLYYPEEGN
jgi:hypothetical protein